MEATTQAERAPSAGPRAAIFAAGGLVVLAGLAAYHDSLSGPFIFDDLPSIASNPTLRHLWPLGPVLSPSQGGLTTSGRPFLNFSFALNYAFGGTSVWGYHAVNLLLHLLAGLTLFGIVRRTLARSRFREKWAAEGQSLTTSATPLAGIIALLWTVHPLQTEAITYTVQRAESLMGLFYLLTLYCFIRYDGGASSFVPPSGTPEDEKAGQPIWAWLSVGACFFGMATKEVMVSAPVIVLLYDRTFAAGSFRAAWQRRRRYYLGLAATWIPLACFVISTNHRGGTSVAGNGVSAWSYWLTQFPAVAHYLALAAWPHPLALDYGMPVARTAGQIVPAAVLVLGLAAATVIALRRWPAWGFLGFLFFAILAPSSLIPGQFQTMAEHRMYLALAPVAVAAVLGVHRLLARFFCLGFCAWLLVAAGYGFMTVQRNGDYRTAVSLWRENVAAYPASAVAQLELGVALSHAGDSAAAIEPYRAALRLSPDSLSAHYNLAGALAGAGRWPEAIVQYEAALRLAPPNLVDVRYNLANAFLNSGRLPEAIAQFEEIVRQDPDYAEAHVNLGIALAGSGRGPEAIRHYEEALELKPDFFPAHYNLAQAQAAMGRTAEAISHYEAARRLRPGDARTLGRLGDALVDAGRYGEAASRYEEALWLEPGSAEIHGSLGAVLIQLGRGEQAVEQFAAASRLQPGNAEIHNILGAALAQLGRGAEARAQFAEALRLKPGDAEARAGLAQLGQAPSSSN